MLTAERYDRIFFMATAIHYNLYHMSTVFFKITRVNKH